ncbi:MAG: adenylate/guanylate cyclase domain-containing protein [Actinomycetota bacterium]|nr:adenylate/guanylate cyclase domain-containing protein [Actinomycetota bacterium]
MPDDDVIPERRSTSVEPAPHAVPPTPATEVGRDAMEGASRRVGKLWRSGAAVAAERVQRVGADRLAERLRSQDPALLARLAEIGVVRQAWIDDPEDGPAVQAARPLDVLHRAVESRADHSPAPLSRLGLSAVRALTDLGFGQVEGDAPEATLCFTDLEGFTEYTALEGDDRARTLLDEYYQVAGRIVRSRNGTTVKHIGDGLLLRFADSVDAVRSALAIAGSPPGPLRVRAGLHRGPLLAERGDVFGHTVNVAARIADAARGGQVMISVDVLEVVEATSGLEFGRLKRHRFKGVAERIEVCEVRRAEPSAVS